MILDLEPVFNAEGTKKEFNFKLDFSEFKLNGVKPFASPVRVAGSVGNYAGVVELRGKAAFTLELNCDRCCEPIKVTLETNIFHTLVTELNDETNDELILVKKLRFDLDPLVVEDVFLSLPSKFLCKEDCRGVCQKCGKNLNEGPCDCKKETDPRLSALERLLDE